MFVTTMLDAVFVSLTSSDILSSVLDILKFN